MQTWKGRGSYREETAKARFRSYLGQLFGKIATNCRVKSYIENGEKTYSNVTSNSKNALRSSSDSTIYENRERLLFRASSVRFCTQPKEPRMAKMQVWGPLVKSYFTKHGWFNPSNLAHLFAIHSVGTFLLREIHERTF